MSKLSLKDQTRHTLQLYWEATLHFKKAFLLSFCSPLSILCYGVIAPLISSHILANLIQGNAQSRTMVALLAGTLLLGALFNRIGMTNLMELQARGMLYLNDIVFKRLLERGTRFYANQISGKLISDVTDFSTSYSMLNGAIFVIGLNFAVTIIAGLCIVLANSWQLGLFLLVFITIVMAWTAYESRRRNHLRNARLKATKSLISHVADNITNMTVVKTFAHERVEYDKGQQLNEKLAALREGDWKWTVKSGTNRMSVVFITQILLMVLLIQLTKTNPAILATGIFAFTYTLTISNKLFDLNALTRQVEEALLNAQPVAEMMQQDIEIKDIPQAKKLKVSNGAVDLQGVCFDYLEGESENAIFKNLDLHIKPGERIGLVGSSGGGKSTLTRLLLRFEDIQAGTISIDGQDIAEVTQASLRQSIAYVPQEPLLFHRSIIDNISYGKPGASQSVIESVAKKAHAHDFIKQLSKGYDTLVGERGVKLSGGQKQRVAIARAMLKDAPILILDEATSALDSESEAHIQDALWQLMKGRTVIAIAHRLSTIQHMDRIIVMDEGRIIEQGSHQELLKLGGTYAKLWSRQSGGFIEE